MSKSTSEHGVPEKKFPVLRNQLEQRLWVDTFKACISSQEMLLKFMTMDRLIEWATAFSDFVVEELRRRISSTARKSRVGR